MKKKLKITIISGLLILTAWISYWFGFDKYYFDYLMIIAAVIAGYQVALNAYKTLKRKVLSIDALVTIAAIGALFIGEYWEAAAVTFLFTFGSYLEARTIGKTRNAVFELMEMAPNKASVRRDNKEVKLDADQVKVGETVIIRPGEKIPVDGKVIKGDSDVNQASITGESKPQKKSKDDEVFSGTINGKGYLEVKAKKVGHDTTFSKIIDLVEEAQEEKAPTEKMMEKFSKYYTPGIIVLSIAAYLITFDIRLALTLLVIGCPGALVISTPISIVSGIGNAAKNGVLIKGGKHLEKAGKTDVVVFDKTGTLTQGKPEVTDIKNYDISKDELIRLAVTAENNSEHHLAQAVLNLKNDIDSLKSPEYFESITGKGIKAKIDNEHILIGNKKLLNENNIKISDNILTDKFKFNNAGKTTIFVTKNNNVVGLLAISDPPREKAKGTVNRLKNRGIKTVMLTGDEEKIAKEIAQSLGIDEYKAGLLPEDKVNEIKKIQNQNNIVTMIGDGINDAPSLAVADIGIAMGAPGTDAAIETADIALMADNIEKVPYALGLSKSTSVNIKQNIIFAVLVVFTLLAGVLGRKVFLASGMMVHEVSVLLVTLNAMRLLGYDKKTFLGKLIKA
jgi:Cd2+/Zn2+-exporting ATPase